MAKKIKEAAQKPQVGEFDEVPVQEVAENEPVEVSLEEAQAEDAAAALKKAAEVAEITAYVETLEASLVEAKAKLKVLTGKNSAVRRGPVGVGAFIKGLIVEGKTNDEIMAGIKEQFPANFTNANCINWYRNAIKKWPNGKRPVKGQTSLDTAIEAAVEETPEEAIEAAFEE